ncbi:MAG: pseudouridine synthase [Candidatus Methanomethylophilaceae archaeon]|nr:pseudouridine synthase [Candidatus Methanomethylophilaceae archaeon]
MEDSVRLNKYIADSGVCSRREADRLIEAGKVTVDGRTAEMGEKVTSKNIITVNGKKIKRNERTILLVYNKPPGITCTADEDDETNIIKHLNYPERIFTIGRLDKYSEGLILLTNRGDLVNGIMRSRYGHEKEYIVEVDRVVDDELVRKLSAGMVLSEDETAKPCFVEKISRRKMRMIITQGLNRQIRRMCEKCGCRVTKLKRVRILDIELGDLPIDSYRKATPEELRSITERIDS